MRIIFVLALFMSLVSCYHSVPLARSVAVKARMLEEIYVRDPAQRWLGHYEPMPQTYVLYVDSLMDIGDTIERDSDLYVIVSR